MPLYDFFRNLLGFPGNRYTNDTESNDFRNQFLKPDDKFEESWSPRDDRPSENITQFNMFTDPLEMHRYFEQQMNELLKSFGFGNNGFDDKALFGFNDLPAIGPSLDGDAPQMEPPSTNLRDHFLKPGYHSSKDNNSADSDLDGRVHASDLDSLLKSGPSNDNSLVQRQEIFMPQVRTFGQSISSKTIRNPDGTLETVRTVRDNAGNEETTITRQMGDKKYSVTVRTDKNGKQEKIEDMINIDEQEIGRFTDKWKEPQSPKGFDPNWFENMFK